MVDSKAGSYYNRFYWKMMIEGAEEGWRNESLF